MTAAEQPEQPGQVCPMNDGDTVPCPCGPGYRCPDPSAAPSPATPQPPAETQQDDERRLRAKMRAALLNGPGTYAPGERTMSKRLDALMPVVQEYAAALAARPSADAETLRQVLRIHHPVMRSETGPFSGCRCDQVKLGQDVIQHVATELITALDGPR